MSAKYDDEGRLPLGHVTNWLKAPWKKKKAINWTNKREKMRKKKSSKKQKEKTTNLSE